MATHFPKKNRHRRCNREGMKWVLLFRIVPDKPFTSMIVTLLTGLEKTLTKSVELCEVKSMGLMVPYLANRGL